MKVWYVVATSQRGTVVNIRIVAGPLTLGRAEDEARERVNRAAEGWKFSVVEFDPLAAL